jgi:hypothetical protein
LIHGTSASLAEEGLFVLAGFSGVSKLWLQHIGLHTDPIPDSELIPGVDVQLLTNKPNPFREQTSLRIYLQEEIPIEVQIFNIRGQLVIDLYSGLLQKGLSNVHWNGKIITATSARPECTLSALVPDSARKLKDSQTQ